MKFSAIWNLIKPKKNSYLREAYTQRVHLSIKIIGFVAIVLTTFLLVNQIDHALAIESTWGVAIVLASIHTLLTYPNFTKVILVWILNAVLITYNAVLASQLVQNTLDSAWTAALWVVGFLAISALFTTAAYVFPRHKIWLTLLLVFIAMGLSATPLVALTNSTVFPLLIAPLVGLSVFLLRIVFPRTKNALKSIEQVEDLSNLTKQLSGSNITTLVKTADGQQIVTLLDRVGHIRTVHYVDIEDFVQQDKKGQLTVQSTPLNDWLAYSSTLAKNTLPRNTPFIHIVVFADGSGFTSNQPMAIRLTNRNTGKDQIVLLSKVKTLHKTVQDSINYTSSERATKQQIKRIGFAAQRKPS